MRTATEWAEVAQTVASTYIGRRLGPGVYLVQHPDDETRSYTVDSENDTCNCKASVCGGATDCKHRAAIRLLQRRRT